MPQGLVRSIKNLWREISDLVEGWLRITPAEEICLV